MRYERLPDCRPQRPDDGLTSASSHPELTPGEFAMRPRIHVVLTPEELECFVNRSRGVVMSVILLAVVMMAVSLFQREATPPLSVVAEQQR